MALSVYELNDLYDAMMIRMDQNLLPAITYANRIGELDKLLDSLGMSDLMNGDQSTIEMAASKILVIGQSMVTKPKLCSIARKMGFDADRFEFFLDYDGAKHYDFAKLRYSTSYRAIFVGPMPHSAQGKGDSGSIISEMQSHPDIYPEVIELRDSTGLKITNNSFKRALEELNPLVSC